MGPTIYCLVIASVLIRVRGEVHEPTVYLTAIGDGPGDSRGQIQVSGDQINAYLKTLQNVPSSIYKGAHLITHMEEDQFGDDGYQPSASKGDKLITATKVESAGNYDDGYNYDDEGYDSDHQPRSASKYEYDYDEKESPRDQAKSYRKAVVKPTKDTYPTSIYSVLGKLSSKPSKYSGGKFGYDNSKPQVDVEMLREMLDVLVKQIETMQPPKSQFTDYSVDPPKRDLSRLPTDYLDNPLPKKVLPIPPLVPPFPFPMYGLPPPVAGSIPVLPEGHPRKGASEKKIFMKANELLKMLTGTGSGGSAAASTEVETFAPTPAPRPRKPSPPSFTPQQVAAMAALNAVAHFAQASTPSSSKVSGPSHSSYEPGYGMGGYPAMPYPMGFYPGFAPFNPYMPFAAASYMHALKSPCPKTAGAGFPFGPYK